MRTRIIVNALLLAKDEPVDVLAQEIEASATWTKMQVSTAGFAPILSILGDIIANLNARNKSLQEQPLRDLREAARVLLREVVEVAHTVDTSVGRYGVTAEERAYLQETLYGDARRCQDSRASWNFARGPRGSTELLSTRVDALRRELEMIRSLSKRLVHSPRAMRSEVCRSHNLDIVNCMSESLTRECERFTLENGVTLETITNRTLSQFHDGSALPMLGRLPRVARARLIAHEDAWRCLPGTCQEILTDLECWADGTSSSESSWGSARVLHLTGGAYTGKTTIATELCRRLRARGRLGASSFCFGSVDGDDEPGLFFPTIAAELARTHSALYGSIGAVACQTPYQHMLNVRWACAHLFEMPLQTLPPDHPPICIVVDSAYGGDAEFSPQWQALLRKLVACTATWLPAQIRLLLTSRGGAYSHFLQGVLDTQDLAHPGSVHSLSLHAYSGYAARDIRAFVVSRMEEHEWSKSWVMRNPALVDRLVADAAGWFPYADATTSWILEDHHTFDQRVSLLTSGTAMPPTPCLPGDLGPLAWPGPLQNRLDKMSSEIQRATRVNGLQTTVASACIGYIPDFSEAHNVTPRLLGLLTGYPTTRILDALCPYRSIVVSASGRLTAESTVFFLHPLCRAFLAAHIVGLATARLCIEPAAMERKLISGCARLILGCLPDIPFSPAMLARYAQEALPLAEYDMDDVEYAFTYLREHPVPNQGDIASLESGLPDGVLGNKRGIRLDPAMLDELYLWLCVMPRMAGRGATSPV